MSTSGNFHMGCGDPNTYLLRQTDCQRRLDVINRGLSGYNTANELVILPDLLPSTSCAKVDYVVSLDLQLGEVDTSDHQVAVRHSLMAVAAVFPDNGNFLAYKSP